MPSPTQERIAAADATVLLFIVRYKRENDGNAPTVREIMENTPRSSTSLVLHSLDRLERQGRIKRTRGIARGISLPKEEVTNE